MPNYRFYRLDGAGQISTAEWIEASDDDDARLKAESLAVAGAYELWLRDRLVERPSSGTK